MTDLASLEQAAHEGAFGDNSLPLPSDAQIEAGNYKKGKQRIYGLDISIEQPKNSYRSGFDKNGTKWACRLAAHYGYIKNTIGADGDPVDCFIGCDPQAEEVYIINQFIDGKFDECKVMLWFAAEYNAISAYQLSYEKNWQGLNSIVPATAKQFKWWLKNGDMSKPLLSEKLPLPGFENMQKVRWNKDNYPENLTFAKLMYGIQFDDSEEKLLDDPVVLADIYDDADEVMALDALAVPYSQLDRKVGQIKRIFDAAGSTLKVLEATAGAPSPLVSEPFKKNGQTYIATVFEFTDGQTLTIYWFNPDKDPNKLNPDDTMLAFKWLINKKDITIIVAAESGQDLNPREVAGRVMHLLEGNSNKFVKANAKRAETMQKKKALEAEIADLEEKLKIVKSENEIAKVAADERAMAKLKNSVHTSEQEKLGSEPIIQTETQNTEAQNNKSQTQNPQVEVSANSDMVNPSERASETQQQKESVITFDAEIAELEGLIGSDGFGDKIDALIEKIDQAGLMAQYEPKLLELDRANSNAIAKGV